MRAAAAILLSLPIAALASHFHGGHRRHHPQTRNLHLARRGVSYALEDDYSGPNFFGCVNSARQCYN
jgi:hypothetical protein